MMYPSKKKKTIAATVSILLAASSLLLEEVEIRKRRWWIKPWLQAREREGNLLLTEKFLCTGDKKSYSNFLRMDETTFSKLLRKVEDRITKQSILRECISAKDKLVITLRYLATGESFRSLMYSFRISESTISLFIPMVCRVIYEELKDEYLKMPNTAAEWLNISKDFETLWNMPNVIGAMDGKHILIQAPGDQGSAFYNYKGSHSIVLLAVVDANYNFLYINVGMNGRMCDGGVYWQSDLCQAIENNWINIPEDKPLPGREKCIPHVFVADAAFSSSQHILKPYPFKGLTRTQRIFNYRLSRARRVVENTFGILANRFRVLLGTSPLKPDKVKTITQACCVLHNFLRKELKSTYIGNDPDTEIDNQFRFMYGLAKQQSRRPNNEILRIRKEFEEYVNGCGVVPWQNNVI